MSEATADRAAEALEPERLPRPQCRDCAGDGLSGPGRLLLQHATMLLDSLVEHAAIELDGAHELDLPANPIVEMVNLLIGLPAHWRSAEYDAYDAYRMSLALLRAAQWTDQQAQVWMGCETCGGRGSRRPM
jgi:hypothetical protein